MVKQGRELSWRQFLNSKLDQQTGFNVVELFLFFTIDPDPK